MALKTMYKTILKFMYTVLMFAKPYLIGSPPQQCTHDFPYSFDYGKRCCHYGKDLDENPLSSRSNSCYRNAEMRCSQDHCVDNSKYFAFFRFQTERASIFFIFLRFKLDRDILSSNYSFRPIMWHSRRNI